MAKLDLKKELKHLFSPSPKEPEVLDVPEMNFAMVDGIIKAGTEPAQSQDFQDAIGALYGVSFTLKFMFKLGENPIDCVVMPLEGLWWLESGEFRLDETQDWHYTAMIMQPGHITTQHYEEALEQLRKKKDNPALSKIRFQSFHEGPSVQIMHVGPYVDEGPTIEKLHRFAAENGYTLRGNHHEIYMGDPRRCKPEKLKTILRHPVE